MYGKKSAFIMCWKKWYLRDGKEGEEPPEIIKRLFKAVEEFTITTVGTEEYMRLGKEILTINVEGLYNIGTVGMVPVLVIAKNNLRNFLENVPMSAGDYGYSIAAQPDQWFFKE